MSRQPQQPQNELVMWYNSIPVCTRFLFTSFVAVTLVGNMGLVDPWNLIYSPQDIFTRFQIWRLYTPFFFHEISLNGAIQLYFLYKYSAEIENTRFAGRTADYVYFLLVEAGLILIIGWLLEFTLFNQSLLMSIIYLWSQQYRDTIVTFIFGLRFKGAYFPWVLLAFDSLQMRGALPWQSLIGIVTGHIYYFLQDLYPASGGPRLLNTPQWLYSQFPPSTNGIRASFGPPRNSSENQPANTHRWGRGQRLGT